MKYQDNSFVYSPSDLILFMESPFASWMEHLACVAPDQAPERDETDSMLALLQDKGGEHESEVLAEFIVKGLNVQDLSTASNKEAATIEAMKSGADVIFQACLTKKPFMGFADFLIKVPGQSLLGDYHYEIWDTKLSKTIKPYFTVQLCCYQEMIESIQGRRSENFVVVLGNKEPKSLRTDDFYFYYESIRNAFLQTHEQFDLTRRPDPADSKSWGAWEGYANQLLKEADHLSQVATITKSQIKKLNTAGIYTMQGLAESQLERIPNFNQTAFERLKFQARLQKSSEGFEQPNYKVLVPEEGQKQGLSLLPPHSDADVFFDIEGFPLADGGLEYLWGNTYFDESGNRQFKDFWAHSEEEEKQAFKAFIEWVYARWQKDPSMHIYHYANYEIAACKKLMSRYGICEYEVDQLLRNEVFIDLYKIVKTGLIIGEPKYSIKNVEHLYRAKRQTEVGNGGDSVVVYENWRQNPDGETWQTSKILKDIRDYNIDDCNSTQELVVWLRARQSEHNIAYLGKTEIVEPEVQDEITERIKLRDRLLEKAASMKENDPLNASLIENLAWSLEFHRRESKPVFWRLFDRLGLTEVELLDDLDCLAGCERSEKEPFKPTSRARNLAYEYQFDPNQEFKFSNTKDFYVLGAENEEGQQLKVTLLPEFSNFSQGIITVQAKAEPPQILTLIPDEYVRPDPIPQAIEAVVKAFESNQLGDCAIIDFMKRAYPRIHGREAGQPIAPGHDEQERLKQIISAISHLNNSYLVIQGPPGAGKTYTGKHVIAELLRQGKKVGISSNSHKAINNLLIGTAKYCHESNIHAFFGCTKDTDDELTQLGVSILKNNEIVNHLSEPCVIGTTAWGFSRDDLENQFDYLFVDEAGQVSVANLIGMSRSTKNIILMGDQMQLGQPAQGTHPAESGLSTLDYLLHETPTISEKQGVFLGTTYRMHSEVNQFISDAVYESKLLSHPENDKQIVIVPLEDKGPLNKEAGVIFIPVEHEGNTQASDEEVVVIKQAVNQLLGRQFTDKNGDQRPICLDDMLFVAPYNFQVNKLKNVLGDNVKVGSVDKFQGQEAPIVFFSMCASNASESPRGMDFLFDKNRINVAISRAQSLAIVVGNPSLTNSYAGNVQQQMKVNMFCQLVRYGMSDMEHPNSLDSSISLTDKMINLEYLPDSAEPIQPGIVF
ncbi:TM0106 family RecB-like putative nuclease [Acinetobacter sp. CAAS 2-6]|uniref:TM0106 family RecB-like putative nuclease n=1 Tax=Acinetobacter sp. CAAS 2-6 TaxID=3016358 RepID=UPI002DD67DD5|nr:TM0106 family RecB-like putative nuclease [Acinetobacter sp. CAAS 2-6]